MRKPGSMQQADHLVDACRRTLVSSGGRGTIYRMVTSPPKERFGVWRCRVGTRWHRSRPWARAQLVSGRSPTISPVRPSIPLAAGGAFRRRDPSEQPASCSPVSTRSHATRPSADRVRPVRELGGLGFRAQATRASVGTRPVLAYRQRATRSLRARATITLRRIRLGAPAVRVWNYWLSALSGW